MRTFNPELSARLTDRTSAPVLLAVFHFASGDVFLSDRTVTPTDGPSFNGLVVSWGRLSSKAGGLFAVPLPEMTVVISNTGPVPFSTHMDGALGEDTGAELFIWFDGLSYIDREPLGRFVVSTPVEVSENTVNLTLVSALVGKNLAVGDVITREAWPGADPDSIGRVENIIYGRAKGVPCRAVDAGAASSLVADITALQTTGIELSAVTGGISFPSSGTILAGREKIAYTGLSGNVLTGVGRGAGGTAATDHGKGSAVVEVKPSYTYLVAGHPVKTIGDVFVGGVRVSSGVTRLTSDDGKAKLTFADRFVLEKSVNLAVDEGSHSHTGDCWSGSGSRTSTTRWTASVNPGWTNNMHLGRAFLDSAGYYFVITGNGTNFLDILSVEGRLPAAGTYEGRIVRTLTANVFQDTFSASFNAPAYGTATALCDMGFSAICAIAVSGGYVETKRSLSVPDLGTIVGAKLCAMFGNSVYTGMARCSINGGIFNNQYCDGGGSTIQTVKANLARVYAGAVAWSDFESMAIRGSYLSGSAAAMMEQWVEVVYIPYGGGSSPASGVALTGNSAADYVIGGQVVCDVDGAFDDPSGSVTGAASALIENPADVIRHIMYARMGVPLAETASFSQARDTLAALIPGGYRLAGVIDKRTDALDLIETISAQSMLKLVHDGYTARLRYLSNTPAPDASGNASKVVKASLTVSPTGREEVINLLGVHYRRDYGRPDGPAGYDAVVAASAAFPAGGDASSVSAHGERQPARPLLAGFIRDDASASCLRDYLISRYKDRGRRLRLATFLEGLWLEPGDVFEMDYRTPAFDLAGLKFMVEELGYAPGSMVKGEPDKVFVRAREVG